MAPLAVDDVVPFDDWASAARGCLVFLHRTVGLDVWMVTQRRAEQQVVLHAHPEVLLPARASLPWDSSFCSTMVSGAGPRMATVARAIPAYRDLQTGLHQRVAAYVGVPLVTRDGGVFGTLCGVSSRAQPRTLGRHLPVVEMIARLLSTLLPEPPPPADGAPA